MHEQTREEALWQELADEAGEDLIEAAAAVSVEQAEKELREAGFDVAAERARAESFLLWLEGKPETVAPSAPMVAEAVPQDAPRAPESRAAKPGRRKVRPAVVWLAAAAVVTTGAAVAYVETRPEEPPPQAPASPPTITPAPPPSIDLVAAADLRRRAAVACDANRPTECLTLLDQAAANDPAGDATPEVARLRDSALHILQAKPK